MGKPSKWFLEVFLPSAIEKMQNNNKYPNTMILSDKQADVCYRNMEHRNPAQITGGSVITRSQLMVTL